MSSHRKIGIFDLNFDAEFRKSFHEGSERIFDEGYLTNHSYVRRFEEDFAHFQKSDHVLAVSNGTAALEVVLRALSVRDKVVYLPTNTFIATHVAVLAAGGIPKLLDIEPEAFSIDVDQLEAVLDSDCGAVITVHIGGLISPHIERLARLCQDRGVPLVEDCAHAHGASLGGTMAGNFGIAGCFSTFMTKVVTTGEGGLITTQNAELFSRAESVRQFGRDPANTISHIQEGDNYKLGEFQALLGTLDLGRAHARIAQRQLLAERYQHNLAGSPWKTIRPAEGVQCPYYKQIVLSPYDREKVVSHLSEHGIATTGGVYYLPLHRQPVYATHYAEQGFPISDSFADTHFCPPCYPELSKDDVDFVCEQLLTYKD